MSTNLDEEWVTLATMPSEGGTDYRMYHSTAVVLPDGRVLSAGGQHPDNEYEMYTGRFFNPPYLTRGHGRPSLSSVPAVINYGETFSVHALEQAYEQNEEDPFPTQPYRMTLLRLNAATHGFDHNQRLIFCTFEPDGQIAGDYDVIPPANAHIAPPGYYMLTFVDSLGTPSISKYVQLIDD